MNFLRSKFGSIVSESFVVSTVIPGGSASGGGNGGSGTTGSIGAGSKPGGVSSGIGRSNEDAEGPEGVSSASLGGSRYLLYRHHPVRVCGASVLLPFRHLSHVQ